MEFAMPFSGKMMPFWRKNILTVVALVFTSLMLVHYLFSTRSVVDSTIDFLPIPTTPQEPVQEPSKYAYATFFSTRVDNDTADEPYFTATRVLTYQLLYRPETRTRKNIPFLIIVPPHVSERKIKILRDEGATVLVVDYLLPDSWKPDPGVGRWIDQFTKLRLFEQTQYERIAYMDNDMLVTRPLDDIFDEIEVTEHATPITETEIKEDEAPYPAKYVVAAVTDNWGAGGENHPAPVNNGSQLNGGFFVLEPSIDLFNYYKSVLEHKDRFDIGFMEMGLLNYAHRRTGNMPWTPLTPGKWNNNWPALSDMQKGSATLHDKFWDPGNKGWIDRELVELWWRVQGQMEGYWQHLYNG
jgi:alpha-N-acetylglucosamine transferase